MAVPDAKACQPPSPKSRKERRAAKEQSRLEGFRPLQEKLESSDPDVRLDGARELRSDLTGAHPPCLDDVIAAGVVPQLLKLSQEKDRHEVQFEALWALTEITGGTAAQLSKAFDRQAFDVLQQLLGSARASPREQAVTILAKLAAASTDLRDALLGSGAAIAVMRVLSSGQDVEQCTYYDEAEKAWKLRAGLEEQPVSVVRRSAQCLRSLCSGTPRPAFGSEAQALLHTLETLVMNTDEEVLAHACAALSMLEYTEKEDVALVIKYGICSQLVELLGHQSSEVKSFAARAAEKVATGSKHGMMAILLCGPVPALKDMLSADEPAIQRDSCSMLNDILAIGGPHIKEVEEAGCIPLLFGLVKSGDEEPRRAATRAIGSLASKCSPQQIEALVGPDAVAPVVKMLEAAAFHSEAETGRAALVFVESVLKAGKQLKTDRFEELVRAASGVEMLQKVTETSSDADLCDRARRIMQSNF